MYEYQATVVRVIDGDTLVTPNGVDVGAALIRLGLAKTWNGKGPKP